MRGGGKVNYTSGSLARAKSKSKKNRSPDRPKASTKALFPQKVLLLTPLKKKSKVKKEFNLEETQSSSPTCKEVMTKEDWMRDSDFAMARDALSHQEKDKEGERGEGWWVDFGGDRDGRKFGQEVELILGDLKNDNERVEGKGWRGMKAGKKEGDGLFDRPDCLDLPHWLRRLPRDQPIIPETPQRP